MCLIVLSVQEAFNLLRSVVFMQWRALGKQIHKSTLLSAGSAKYFTKKK